MSEKVNNIPKKLNINRILIVPVYRKKSSDISYSTVGMTDYVDRKSVHTYDNRWTAVYIKEEKLLYSANKRYFDLLNNFTEIKDGSEVCFDEFIINSNIKIPLINYLNSSKFLYGDSNIIDKDELLYLIKPITLRQKYITEKQHKKVFYDDNKCMILDVYFQETDNLRIIKRKVELHKYFAIDILTGIPYIPKKIIKDNINAFEESQKNNKSLLKRLIRRK